jgi:hypothetical protein
MKNPEPPQPHSPQDGQSSSQQHHGLVKWTGAVAIFTGLLFLVSAISDWFIYWQYSVANRAQIDAREQLRAVVSQNGGAEVTLHQPGPEHKLGGMTFTAHFFNTGGTRTAWFNGWISAHYFDGEKPPANLDLSKPYNEITATNTIIPANTPFDLGPVAIPGGDAEKRFAKQGVGLVWGHAEYADIFEPNNAHPISFCIIVTPQITPQSSADGVPINITDLPPRLSPYRVDCNQSH